jgi:putative salt-induced outer membrane protein YdiY
MSNKLPLLLLALSLFAGQVFAGQVTLKNGDRISGSVVKSDGKELVLKSDLAGTVTIPLDAVTSITSTEPVSIELKDGQTIVGTVTTSDSKFQVVTRDAGTITAPRDTVVAIRSEAEQAEYDRIRNPRITDLWTGFLDLGYATARGNTNTGSFSLNSDAIRSTTRDKIEARFTMLQSSSDASGKSITTANAKRGGVLYSLNITPRIFGFGAVALESDQFQSLDLRFNPSGGLGYHVIKTERSIFDLSVGASEDKEYFSTGLSRSFTEVLIGEEYTYKLNGTTTLHELGVFFPNVTDTGNYRVNFDFGAVTAIKKWFGWQLTVSDRYLSNPLAGHKNNDILISTGLRLTFAKP